MKDWVNIRLQTTTATRRQLYHFLLELGVTYELQYAAKSKKPKSTKGQWSKITTWSRMKGVSLACKHARQETVPHNLKCKNEWREIHLLALLGATLLIKVIYLLTFKVKVIGQNKMMHSQRTKTEQHTVFTFLAARHQIKLEVFLKSFQHFRHQSLINLTWPACKRQIAPQVLSHDAPCSLSPHTSPRSHRLELEQHFKGASAAMRLDRAWPLRCQWCEHSLIEPTSVRLKVTGLTLVTQHLLPWPSWIHIVKWGKCVSHQIAAFFQMEL